jgi:hypothetical protein
MQKLLRRACHAVNLARERDVRLKPLLIELFRRITRQHPPAHPFLNGL